MKISDNILTKLDHPAKIVDLALDWEHISSLLEKKWEEVPDLSAFTQLKKLSLAGHEIQAMEGLPANLRQVDLSYNFLRHTKSLSILPALQDLDLSFNELEDVSEIGSCLALTQLNLAHNFLHDLSVLAPLSKLELLAISGNRRLKDLSFVQDMQELRVFYAKQLSLMDWAALNGLASLKALYISPLSLGSLESFIALPKLRVLHLSVNKVSEEGWMPSFPHLRELSIVKGKHLRRLKGIEQLKGLTHLYLSQNQLEEVPDFNGLDQLEVIDLRQNPLRSADALFGLKKLEKLDIRDTGLEGSAVKALLKHFETAEVLY